MHHRQHQPSPVSSYQTSTYSYVDPASHRHDDRGRKTRSVQPITISPSYSSIQGHGHSLSAGYNPTATSELAWSIPPSGGPSTAPALLTVPSKDPSRTRSRSHSRSRNQQQQPSYAFPIPMAPSSGSPASATVRHHQHSPSSAHTLHPPPQHHHAIGHRKSHSDSGHGYAVSSRSHSGRKKIHSAMRREGPAFDEWRAKRRTRQRIGFAAVTTLIDPLPEPLPPSRLLEDSIPMPYATLLTVDLKSLVSYGTIKDEKRPARPPSLASSSAVSVPGIVGGEKVYKGMSVYPYPRHRKSSKSRDRKDSAPKTSRLEVPPPTRERRESKERQDSAPRERRESSSREHRDASTRERERADSSTRDRKDSEMKREREKLRKRRDSDTRRAAEKENEKRERERRKDAEKKQRSEQRDLRHRSSQPTIRGHSPAPSQTSSYVVVPPQATSGYIPFPSSPSTVGVVDYRYPDHRGMPAFIPLESFRKTSLSSDGGGWARPAFVPPPSQHSQHSSDPPRRRSRVASLPQSNPSPVYGQQPPPRVRTISGQSSVAPTHYVTSKPHVYQPGQYLHPQQQPVYGSAPPGYPQNYYGQHPPPGAEGSCILM